MANAYYSAPTPKQPLNTVRSADFNNNNAGLEAAFDELPPASQLARSQYGEDVSTVATLYKITIPTLTSGYFEGLEVVFQVLLANTGPAQIQVNGNTIVAILDTSGDPLAVGDILVGQIITAIYTSNNVFQVQFTANAVASAAAAAASAVASANSAGNASTSAGAASAAAAAAAASAVELSTIRFGLTTQELIASTEVFTADVIISTSGYAASADGGTGLWIQNGVVGQTASQSPLQLNAALLNDAAGNQWALIGNGPVSALALGPGTTAVLAAASTFSESPLYKLNVTDNVGIGTNSPISKLEVVGDVGIARSEGGYTFRETIGGDERAGIKSGPLNELIFNTSTASERMRIESAGNVGIGTPSPRSILNVSKAGGAILTLESPDTLNDAGDILGGINFFSNDASTGASGVRATIQAVSETSFGINYALSFGTIDAGSSLTERMRIDSTGIVTIGGNLSFHAGNTNFNVFGGFNGEILAQGAALSSTQAIFYFPLNSLVDATGMTFVAASNFYTFGMDSVTRTLTGIVFTVSSSKKMGVVVATVGSGLTQGEALNLRLNATQAAAITVNF
jgi:hypothetical protein